MKILTATLLRISFISAVVCLGVALVCMSARAQTPQQANGAIIGQVTGGDISVVGPSQAEPGENAETITFASGSTLVVHSGQARVEFKSGGELDVCGPAKFTVLASGEAITIALSFGRVHARFDSSRPISIYTPLIIATPLAVADQPRDVTLGVAPTTGAMCVLAAHGAVQVEQQLSGETLIVPQPSEVLLAGTPLGATPAPAGSCQCDFQENSAKSGNSSPVLARETIPLEAGSASGAKPPADPQPSASVPAKAKDAPSVPAKTTTPPAIPANPGSVGSPTSSPKPLAPATQPIVKIEAPPITFEANPAEAQAETISVATLILAKDSVVQPEWIFHGVVAEPVRAQHPDVIPGAPDSLSQVASEHAVKAEMKPKKEGFWAKLRNFFVGRQRNASCIGAACG